MAEVTTYYIVEFWDIAPNVERFRNSIRVSSDVLLHHIRHLDSIGREITKVSKITINSEDETHLYVSNQQYKIVYNYTTNGHRQKGEHKGSSRPFSRTHAEALASGMNEIYGEGSHQAVPLDYTSE